MIAEALLTLALVAQAEPITVKNPSGVAFICPDHDKDDQHEVDIVRESDGAVVQTLLVGDPGVDANGEVLVLINVMPLTFDRYYFVARAVAGSSKSANSSPSATWERAPGSPTKLIVR